MRIQIPVAAYISYNPAVYLEKALREMGHNAFITQGQVSKDDPLVDLFLCVDSGGPLVVRDEWAHKCAFWFIDSRRNCDPEVRQPDDDSQAEKIFKAGGWVFQAQYEDTLRLRDKGVDSTWLPLAADPHVWANYPKENKLYDVAFVGNCYDPTRLEILDKLDKEFNFYWPGIEGAIMEEGAKIYRQSRVGFNISSFYDQDIAYDINMRVFEIMSCGIPLVTNYVLGLDLLPGLGSCPGVFTYQSLDGIAATIEKALLCETVYTHNSIVENHTYKHRAQKILEVVGA